MEKEFVRKILNDFNRISIDFDVYIIANVVSKTINDCTFSFNHAVEDEFFSRTEFAEIASAIFNVFGYVKVFYSEIEFIQYILEKNINQNECIVYNFARDGIVPGKKSLIPAFCDLLNIRFTGSNSFVISLLREKYIYTILLENFNILVPITEKYIKDKGFIKPVDFNNKKILVKQINESASIGLDEKNIFVYDNQSHFKLNQICEKMNIKEVLVQEYISGIECEVLVIEKNHEFHALDPIGIKIKGSTILNSNISNSYSYDFFLLESKVKKEICHNIRKKAEKAAKILGIKNYARFDFRIYNDLFYLIDIAGTPYTIKHSSINYLFTKIYKLEYKDIYKVIVACMLEKD